MRRGDLVIVEQASKLLVNYILFALHLTGFIRLGMWGHGRTVRARRSSALGEALKNAISRHVSWWFAYNERSAAFVRELGFPDDRITRLQNAIDTKALVAAAAAVTPGRLDEARRQLGVGGRHVCIYVGAMYEDKRIRFSSRRVAWFASSSLTSRCCSWATGRTARLVRGAAARDEWMHYLGPRFGDDRVPYMLLAALSLMPGGVGLGVLDSFALGVPLVTTSGPRHMVLRSSISRMASMA